MDITFHTTTGENAFPATLGIQATHTRGFSISQREQRDGMMIPFVFTLSYSFKRFSVVLAFAVLSW